MRYPLAHCVRKVEGWGVAVVATLGEAFLRPLRCEVKGERAGPGRAACRCRGHVRS